MNDDKSAVAILKKGNWQESVEVLCTTPHIYEQKTAQTMATSLTCLSTTR